MPGTITVAAQPSSRARVWRTPPNRTIPDAKKLIATASLTGNNDRNLLTAARLLRNEIQWNPEDKRLWDLGVSVFEKHDALYRARGEAPPVSTWQPDAETKHAMARAQQLADAGDKLGAVRILREVVREQCEWRDVWEAGAALFDATS